MVISLAAMVNSVPYLAEAEARKVIKAETHTSAAHTSMEKLTLVTYL